MSEPRSPWDLGYQAYIDGDSDMNNPFDISSDDALDWNDGFLQAEEDHDEGEVA